MSTYIITYDLNNEVRRPNITAKIRAFPSWAKLSESSYAVSTNMTAGQLYDYLKPMLDADDNLYVIALAQPYAGFGPNEVNSWLQNNLHSAVFV